MEQRVLEHYAQRGKDSSFTGKYHVYYLLYYEVHRYINDAIAREKEIKGWSREKKMKLISELNPNLDLLNEELFGTWPSEILEVVCSKNQMLPTSA